MEQTNDNKAELVNQYRQRAEQGDINAIYTLARCYLHGQLVPQDITELEKYLGKAEELDSTAISTSSTFNATDILTAIELSREKISRRLTFPFEDISKLHDVDIASILKNVEASQWALALLGASEELKNKLFKNMSRRAAKMLQEEIEYVAPQRASDVRRAQREIVRIVLLLEDAGEVTIGTSTDWRAERKYRYDERKYIDDIVAAEKLSLPNLQVLIVSNCKRSLGDISDQLWWGGTSRWHEVLTASNGKEGLEVLEQHPSCQIVISDWDMPEMDGIEFCKAVRALDRPEYIYFIILAPRSLKEMRQCVDAGADDFMTRPYQPDELISRLRAGKRMLAWMRKRIQ